MNHQLRDYQQTAVTDLRAVYRAGYKSPILVMPCRSGKTHVFTYIAIELEKRGFRVLIIVHRSYLRTQCSNKIHDIGATHGIVAPGHILTAHKIQIASINTLIRRLDKIIPPDFIIIDEGHHVANNNQWQRVIQYFYNARVLGVTATPCRTNGQGLGVSVGGSYDTIVPGSSILDLTPEYLTKNKLFAPDVLDMTGVPKRGGDFVQKENEKRIILKGIYGNVPKHYKDICYGVPAIAFCVSIKHTKIVADKFNSCGIPAAAISGKTSEKQRDYLFKGLANGRYMILCSCDLISEGIDVPVCGCSILLRSTQSLVLYLQQCGRGNTFAPGKEYAYIIDHVGNYIRHGFPDQDREWSLDGVKYNKKAEEERTICTRTCPMCFHVQHSSIPKCQECGYIYINGMKLPSVNEKINLKEIETARKKKIETERRTVQGSCNTLDSLKSFAASKGYKPGYVKHVWDARMNKFKNADSLNALYSAAKNIDFPRGDVRREWERRLQNV